ncbi:MAG: CRISPR-associated endonuclease/helicase Cas3 [candidate division WS2 bacterium]|uniref:CRISPR-associated endonuclease/helicase Cas3 n=1 Tax=Psychracetigena formicireducens TaxID=2986056 RepID=A0A9E2BIL6_PSYF1|nr:CRISPR-associated endonuclease/helicase Cas3 [Candidatus Psychracetigena formicireducens]
MVTLAKRTETLLEHTENALNVFRSMRRSYTNAPEMCGVEHFWEHLFYSIFLHDFGKGAVGFQNIFEKGEKWSYRHEILSAGFVSSLDYSDSLYKDAIGLAIITHHKDVLELRERFNTFPSPVGKERYGNKLKELEPNFDELRSYYNHIPEFSEKYLGYKLNNFRDLESPEELEDVYKTVVLPYFNAWEDERKTKLHGKYGVFLKGFLTACDHLASGSKYGILNAIENMREIYQFEELRCIQEKAIVTKGDSLLTAPTGSGKTEAALFWSDTNQNTQKSKRVFYLLPYTASINAMYKRLQKDFMNEELVGLQHGKAAYFLYKAFSDDGDYVVAKDRAKAIRDLTKKIYRPYKILTPFQILKAFFGMRGFEQQLSEMTNGLFILDEIHAYDAHTTALILEMLKILKQDYGANLFIMSATLPEFIRDLFRESLEINVKISMDEETLKKFTRHRVEILAGSVIDNLDRIKSDLQDGKRILVVCNTVSRAQEVFRELSPIVKKSALLHGRFMLRDREKIEDNLQDMHLLVGTQAIEVSLNIDYDILYSEPAPIDALIQRFGRVNRMGWGKISPVYVFSKGSDKDKYVYNEVLVKQTLDNLGRVDLLEEDIIQTLVDNIYKDGYTGKDEEVFENVQRLFKPFYNQIVPFIHDKRNEENFYSLYQSYEVIPLKYKEHYLEEIKKSRYFEAMSYFTSISVGQYKRLERGNNVDICNSTRFVNAKYDGRLGLILDEAEIEASNII